jgi:hypothetical protein
MVSKIEGSPRPLPEQPVIGPTWDDLKREQAVLGPLPEVKQEDVARLYDEAVGEGASFDVSREEFLVLPPGIQTIALGRAFGGDGGVGYGRPQDPSLE